MYTTVSSINTSFTCYWPKLMYLTHVFTLVGMICEEYFLLSKSVKIHIYGPEYICGISLLLLIIILHFRAMKLSIHITWSWKV